MSELTVIFLDVDGPLIPFRAWARNRRWGATARVQYFDQCAVAVILEACQKTEARLVISSSWRHLGRERVEASFGENGISALLFHEDWRTTTRLEGGADRAGEILEWVGRHEPDVWVAVDDSDLTVSHEEGPTIPEGHFVKCSMADGLDYQGQKRLLKLLGSELGVTDPRQILGRRGCEELDRLDDDQLTRIGRLFLKQYLRKLDRRAAYGGHVGRQRCKQAVDYDQDLQGGRLNRAEVEIRTIWAMREVGARAIAEAWPVTRDPEAWAEASHVATSLNEHGCLRDTEGGCPVCARGLEARRALRAFFPYIPEHHVMAFFRAQPPQAWTAADVLRPHERFPHTLRGATLHRPGGEPSV